MLTSCSFWPSAPQPCTEAAPAADGILLSAGPVGDRPTTISGIFVLKAHLFIAIPSSPRLARSGGQSRHSTQTRSLVAFMQKALSRTPKHSQSDPASNPVSSASSTITGGAPLPGSHGNTRRELIAVAAAPLSPVRGPPHLCRSTLHGPQPVAPRAGTRPQTIAEIGFKEVEGYNRVQLINLRRN